jgi:hypothetical protein
MATITPTTTTTDSSHGTTISQLITWANMANGDIGAPVEVAPWMWRSLTLVGGSGTLGIEFSNDGTNWHGFTADGTEAMTSGDDPIEMTARTRYCRPSGTTTATTLTLHLFVTRPI